jgi:cysteine-rich repeat protein
VGALVPDVGAQTLMTPPFVVGIPSDQRSTHTVDLAQSTDGAILFTWDEIRSPTSISPIGYVSYMSRFAVDGTSLPIAPGVPRCCSVRPMFPRLAAYDSSGYTRLVSGGGASQVLAVAGELDDLGAPRPNDYGQQIGQNGIQGDGHGGAVGTFGTHALYLMWDDVDDRIIGRGPRDEFVTPGPSDANPFIDVATIPDRGLVAGWGSSVGVLPHAMAVFYDQFGVQGALVTLSTETTLRTLAASPRGDRIALVGTRPTDTDSPTEIWARFFTSEGLPLGDDFLVYAALPGDLVAPDAAFDAAGNLYIVWTEGGHALRVVGIADDGTPSGPVATLLDASLLGDDVRTIRLRDPDLHDTGRFMNAWTHVGGTSVQAAVVSLCAPGTSVCGDGLRNRFCEFCDEGQANSDTAADACRTDCRPARCGDGVVDGTEACDDGNREDCDGCSRDCVAEVALGCGNGVAFPACGEMCDDGNLVEGDGCSNTCRNEITWGGSAATECALAWSVENPANDPLVIPNRGFSFRHTCTDDDPRCDFDGGTPGRCTFHVRACANNSTLPPCSTHRLATWELEKPSARDAAKDPVAAVIADALRESIPGAVVGPDEPDVCSAPVSLVVPLRARSNGWVASKPWLLRARATLYDGREDSDKLVLRCLPKP